MLLGAGFTALSLVLLVGDGELASPDCGEGELLELKFCCGDGVLLERGELVVVPLSLLSPPE